MSAKVRVNMFPCGNTTEIEVCMNNDGDYAIKALGTCPKAIRFIEGLNLLTLTDLTDKKESKVFRDFVSSDMSANCLVISGAMTAAWIEAGMIARSNTKKGISPNIEFVES